MSFRIEDLVGLVLFSDTFREYRNDYVIIGGIATAYATQTAGLEPRLTRDIDLIIYSNPNTKFANKLSSFVTSGRYQGAENRNDQKTNKYRFTKPVDRSYPPQIEIFSINPFTINLPDEQHIVPVPTDDDYTSLSAILIDPDYAELARQNRIFFGDAPLLNIVGLICFKIAAYNDLMRRKQEGESIDRKVINKHRNDIFVLSVILNGKRIEIPARVRMHVQAFVDRPELRSFDGAQLNQILSNRGIGGQSISGILDKLGSCLC